MNLTVKKNGGFPSLLTDFFSPNLLGRDFFDFDSDMWPTRLGVNVPTVNIKETPKEFKLELAAPGPMERKDFNIEVENNILSISAEKEEEKKEGDGEYSRKEYSFNSFSRTFTLPENVKEDNIKAKYENGVLKLVIPKLKESPVKPAHKIDVT